MGARVYSIDKAPLDERVAAMPGVDHHIGSGFGLEPKNTGRVDWLFSDMAC
jgi:23S rRNA (cytidine2498-2'-O)-methyltransferase